MAAGPLSLQLASAPESQTNAAARAGPHRDRKSSPSQSSGRSDHGKALGVVEVFISGQAAVDRLAQPIRQRQLRVLAAAIIGQVVGDELIEPEPLVLLPNQQQAGVGGDSWALKINLKRRVEREVEGPVLFLTHWVHTSGTSSPRLHSHKH
jgi:hypothetical protein